MSFDPEELIRHYSSCWDNTPVEKKWARGPTSELPESFSVLEFSPTASRRMWTYVTCGMSASNSSRSIELHLFSPIQNNGLVELLTVVAHYHCTDTPLGLGHTINFGRPWLPNSSCSYGLISLPYLDGPELEKWRRQATKKTVECLWLLPITLAERDFKIKYGLDALEAKFEEANFNYLDPLRESVV